MGKFFEEHVIPNLWEAGTAVVAAIWVWWKTRPKEKIEKDGGIVDNAKKVLEMSEDIADRLEKQLIASDEIIQQLKEKLRIALEEENSCKKALKAIKEEYANFQKLFNEQKLELDALKEECRLLRVTIEQNEKTNTINNSPQLN